MTRATAREAERNRRPFATFWSWNRREEDTVMSSHSLTSQSRILLVRRSFFLAPLAWALPARAQPVIPPSLLERGARLLADLIQSARETAIANGVRPMPPQIHRALLGLFPRRDAAQGALRERSCRSIYHPRPRPDLRSYRCRHAGRRDPVSRRPRRAYRQPSCGRTS